MDRLRQQNDTYTQIPAEPEFDDLAAGFGTFQMMPIIRPRFLSSADRIALEACVRRQREDHGIARRANAILLLDDGESCARIAKFLYLDDDTIRGWYKSYRQDGWDALAFDGWKVGQFRKRWPREFGPIVKVDPLVREMIQNDETKEPFVPLPGSLLFAKDERGISRPRLRLKRSARK
jgi:hypothetical protein